MSADLHLARGLRWLLRVQVVDEADLLEYLEDVFGEKTILSCKILRHHNSAKSMGLGFVQFRDEELMAQAVNLSSEGKLLLYNRELKFILLDKNTVKRTASSYYTLEYCRLSVGCLTSKETMLSFWSYRGSLKMEINLEEQTLAMIVGFTSMDYKMVFHLSDIWQLAAAEVSGGGNKGLLIQAKESPPYLYCRPSEPSDTNDKYLDIVLKGCLVSKIQTESESWDKAWVRTTDFTASNVIGQSSAYVVELESYQWQTFLSFVYITGIFQGVSRTLRIQKGATFAASQLVVPMVNPEKCRVPFDILYKVNNLIQYGNLCGPTLDERFFKLISTGSQYSVKLALQSISTLKEVCYDPVRLVKAELDEIKKVAPPAVKLGKGKTWIHRLLVTPSKVYCLGPEVEKSNRIIRQYEEYSSHFLRVNFVDENFSPLSSTVLISDMHSSHSDVYRRVKEVLKQGIFIGNRKYDFLAFSASQLREGQIWMFAEKASSPGAEKPLVTADSIRTQMGDFSQIRNVAKCAARMGQCFSSSTETMKVLPLQVKKIKDITVRTDGVTYCFSDGIGKISKDFAQKIADACGLSGRIPSAFQIRYGGYKGVVAVDPRASSSFKLYLRPSMHKFDSPHMSLEVLDWTRAFPCFLNRQVISLLSTLGVKDEAFISLQSQMISDLEHMLEDDAIAMKVLSLRETSSSSIALQMLQNGYTPKTEPLLKRLLCVFRDAELHDLRIKAKIFVPKGRLLMGCLDETKTLKYGEVFIKISTQSRAGEVDFDEQRVNDATSVVTEKVFVAKNPCLHPGDVRVLQGVDVPLLHHMVDCVIFPQLGPKSHPHECSGSDLDGDLYLVSWDETLIPPTVDPPMDYSPPAVKTLDHPVTIEEIQEFFLNYMTNDNLGVIANAHVVHADKETKKARNPKCLELAHLASLAVDFPKTGVPAVIPNELRPREYPDFMEKEGKVTYTSCGVMGKLYRSTKATRSMTESESKGCLIPEEEFFDNDLRVRGYEKHVESALAHKHIYDMKLMQLMNHYGIGDEAEIIGGHVLAMSQLFVRRQIDVLPKVRMAFDVLKQEARSWFSRRLDSSEVDAKASAWYYVSYHRDHYGCDEKFSKVLKCKVHLLSFPWVVADFLFAAKRKANRLEDSMRRDLEGYRNTVLPDTKMGRAVFSQASLPSKRHRL